jgi:hypothetical protein
MIGHSHRLLHSPSRPTQCPLNFSYVEVHLLSFYENLRNLEMQSSNCYVMLLKQLSSLIPD